MTRDEAIAYGKEQLEIFGGTHREFILMAIEALEQYENAFEHGYTEAESKYREILERKRGEWIETSSGDHWKCSRCNYRAGFWFDEENSCEWSMDVSEWLSNFCPNCGADMRGDEDE